MQTMTPTEWRSFLLAGPRTGKLATVRPDGRPHVAPIWFDLEGDELVFTTWHTTVKAANLRRDGRVALCVDDDRPPFAYVLIEGAAHLVEADPDLFYWAARIAGRYLGPALAEPYGRRNAVPGEFLVRVKIERVIARRGITD